MQIIVQSTDRIVGNKVIEEIILCSVVTNVCFWVALHRQPEFIKLKEILSRILSIVRIKKS